MKKRMLAIMMSALMAAGICSSVTVYADADSKTLTVGFDAEYPPFGYMDESGEYVGFDLDVAQKVCDNLGWELVKKPINWDSKDMELNSGNIDCIWNGLTYSEDRAKTMLCSESYMDNHQVLVLPADSKIKSLADIKKQSVGVQKGSTASDAIDKTDELKDADIRLMADNVQILNDLGNGLQAAVMDEVVAKYYTSKDKGKYKVLDVSLATEKYVIGFRKDDKALCEEVEKQLKAMAKDGTLEKISKKWFNEDITTIK